MNKYKLTKKFSVVKSLIALSISVSYPALSADQKVLEEILVTAEHRSASVQDTQIAITAMTAEDVQDMGISNPSDIGNFAPNLVVNTFQGGKSGVGINMRGMGQNETLVSYDPAIGLYIDDVLLSKSVGSMLDVIDIERIEILRGPQGTLYGRNTMGGTVNFITKKPTDVLEGKLGVTVGAYGQLDLKGVLNIPLAQMTSPIGALSARVSGAKINRDGLTDNDLAGAPNRELDTKDRAAYMAHLMWDPSDLLKVLYTFDRTEINETPGTPWTTGVNLNRTAGGMLEPYSIGYRADRPDSVSVNGEHIAKTSVNGQALHIDFSLADNLDLKSITARREMENFSTADSDGSPLTILQTIDEQTVDLFTQEFRLTGVALDSKLDYTAGLFYMEENGTVDQGLAAFGSLSGNQASFTNKNWALYGQATYFITDRLDVSAGLRYTEEDQRMTKRVLPSGGAAPIEFGTAQQDFNNISPMVSISYDWSDEVMTYFKVSSGFQAGGFNVRDTNVDSNSQPTTFHNGYDEEILLAYELGVKADMYERIRVNAALWYSDYDDKRVNNFDAVTLGNTVRNAGVVDIYGAEVEALAQLSDSVQLGANWGYTKPNYVEYESPNPANPSEILDLSGVTNFPYTPRTSANIFIGYEYGLNIGLLKARLDWAFKDNYNFLAPQPERNDQEHYEVWNARVSLDDIDGPGDTQMRVALWGKNITDESYYTNGVNIYSTFGFDINSYAEPMTYGVDFELRF